MNGTSWLSQPQPSPAHRRAPPTAAHQLPAAPSDLGQRHQEQNCPADLAQILGP